LKNKEEIFLSLVKKGKYRWTPDYMLIGPRGKIEKTFCGKYRGVSFMDNSRKYTVLLHRIVFIFFVGEIEGELTVNHKNGNHLDNHPDNLELLSKGENTLHSLDVLGNRKIVSERFTGHRNRNAKLSVFQVHEIREKRKQGDSIRALARGYGMSHPCILRIINGISYRF